MIEIENRHTGHLICVGATHRDAVEAAYASGEDLSEADLEFASLDGIDLRYARLHDVGFYRADLENACFEGASLIDSSFTEASLSGASFKDADLTGAGFSGAKGVDLRGADLSKIREDFFDVLSASPNEVPGLRLALVEGRVAGTVYVGECSCLIGTLANVAGCHYEKRPNLMPDCERPSERWFLGISEGDTPLNSQFVEITVEWIDEWLRQDA